MSISHASACQDPALATGEAEFSSGRSEERHRYVAEVL